jgi:hypothetical protein
LSHFFIAPQVRLLHRELGPEQVPDVADRAADGGAREDGGKLPLPARRRQVEGRVLGKLRHIKKLLLRFFLFVALGMCEPTTV